MHRQHLTIAVILSAATSFAAVPAAVFGADAVTERTANLQPPSRTLEDAFSLQDAAPTRLRAPAAALREQLDLPFGLNYSRDTKSLLMPLDDRREWGLGLNLNLNSAPAVELSPPGLHLAPKRTPGLMLQKRF
jgi:hypothetical protein